MRLTACLLATLVVACGGGKAVSDAVVDTSAAADGGVADEASEGPALDGADNEAGDDIGTSETGGIDGGISNVAQLTATPSHASIHTTVDDSPSLIVEIKNTGGVASGPLIPSLIGPDADRFEVFENSCSNQSGLQPGNTCSIFVTFDTRDLAPDPTLGTEANATLVVADSGPGGSVATTDIAITLVVASNGLSILGPPDMGTIPLGAAGASLTFIVANTGSADSGPLVVSLSSPELVESADTCTGNSLPMAATCSFAVQFLPTTLGTRWAVLTVQDSAGSSLASEFISGTCVGP